MSLYSQTVQDHVANPRNVGILDPADGVGRATNDACGDMLHLYLRLDAGRISAASFQATGCPPSLAVGSLLTELLVGLTPDQARALDDDRIVSILGGVPRAKRHAAALARDAIHLALA